MNKTFKLAIACVFSLCLTQSYAQTVGVKAGDLSEFRMINGAYNLNENTKPNPGFHAEQQLSLKRQNGFRLKQGFFYH